MLQRAACNAGKILGADGQRVRVVVGNVAHGNGLLGDGLAFAEIALGNDQLPGFAFSARFYGLHLAMQVTACNDGCAQADGQGHGKSDPGFVGTQGGDSGECGVHG